MDNNGSFFELKKELLVKEVELISSDSETHWGLTFRIKAWAVSIWILS